MSLAFLLVATFVIILFLVFFLLFLRIHICTRHIASNFPCWLYWFQLFTHYRDQTKKLREMIAAYLLYKCKHLCMIIFSVVSRSKKVYELHIAGYVSKFNNMTAVM